MSDLPHLINFIKKQHVVSLCCQADDDLWCANCFYIFDEANMSLILMTQPDTRHGVLLQANPRVAGTISGQPKTVLLIKGVQYRGMCLLLSGEAEDRARKAYQKRFPVSRAVTAPLWEIRLEEVKMTDNSLGFGHKIVWQRED